MRTIWKTLAASVAIAALAVSPVALAAKKKTPTTDAARAETKGGDSASASAKTDKVNLNTADEKTIAGAKGVGPKLAAELVKGRPYKTWDDVSKVKGVGSGKKLDSLKKVLKLSEGVGAAKDSKTSILGETPAPAPTRTPRGGTPSRAASSVASGKDATESESNPTSRKTPSSSATPKLAVGEKININTASAADLDKLPEIGPVKAQAIVDYRAANGKFTAPEDIMKVPGIKEGTFAKIKDSIVVR